jgi:general stress protein CsbA
MPWHTALFGSLAFGFSTYLLIILQVGHNTKALAVSFIPFVLAGLLLVFERKKLLGFILTTLALGMQIRANHYQMTYYLLLLMGVFVIVFGIQAWKEKKRKSFLGALGVLLISGNPFTRI